MLGKSVRLSVSFGECRWALKSARHPKAARSRLAPPTEYPKAIFRCATRSRRLVTVVWYHDTMTKNITVRLPDELAADAEALARVDGTSLNETVKKSLLKEVERRRKSPEFKARLTRIIEEDRELLERLAR